jgi:hypothetical protein
MIERLPDSATRKTDLTLPASSRPAFTYGPWTLSGQGGKVSEAMVERGSVSSFGVVRRGKTGPFHGPWKHPALQTRPTIAFGGGLAYVIGRAGGR